jgi:hypothetical protein
MLQRAMESRQPAAAAAAAAAESSQPTTQPQIAQQQAKGKGAARATVTQEHGC